MRKHQESMAHTENNLMALRSHLENRFTFKHETLNFDLINVDLLYIESWKLKT